MPLHPAGTGDCETRAKNADDVRSDALYDASDAPYDASTRRTKVQLRWRAGVTFDVIGSIGRKESMSCERPSTE